MRVHELKVKQLETKINGLENENEQLKKLIKELREEI
jgi:cell division protein FtsB